MASELAEQVESAWMQSKKSHRIGVSEFTHGRKWRSELAECGVMEVFDRDKTCAWLISYECMDAIMLRIEELEDMLEEVSLSAMIRTRADNAVFKRGPEAIEEAIAFFNERYGDEFPDEEDDWLGDRDEDESESKPEPDAESGSESPKGRVVDVVMSEGGR